MIGRYLFGGSYLTTLKDIAYHRTVMTHIQTGFSIDINWFLLYNITIKIIVLVLVLFYQKMLEYKYVRLITEGTDIEYKITNRELFIYGIFINNILIAIILFKLALNELDGEYLIIVFALLILLIAKFIKNI